MSKVSITMTDGTLLEFETTDDGLTELIVSVLEEDLLHLHIDKVTYLLNPKHIIMLSAKDDE